VFKETDINKNLPARIKLHKPAPTGARPGTPQVTSEAVDKVRSRVLFTVQENLPNVRNVLGGRLKWTNQQVKLFQIMLNKVLPDLSASMNEHMHKHKTIDQLTRAELEAIVAQGKRADKEDPINTIDADFTEEDSDMSPEEALERFNTLANNPHD